MFNFFLGLLKAIFSTPTPPPTINTPTPVMPEPLAPTPTYDTPQNAYHAVRVLCDNNGLTLDEKNTICACIYQESQFKNTAVGRNKNAQGVVLSTDWGLCQINDYWHVKKYPDFPSAEYIVDNPDKAVQFMITAYKNGGIKQWVSYSSGAYHKWLLSGSPMWRL